ncbi:MAG: CsoS2 family carboxysome shell protein, partial [Thiohalospira sp.]
DRAMAEGGKAALREPDRTRGGADAGEPAETGGAPEGGASKEDCGCGCKREAETGGEPAPVRTSGKERDSRSGGRGGSRSRSRTRRPAAQAQESAARTMAKAKRKAQAERGKAAQAQGALSPAQAARQANPEMSGREVARKVREKRAKQGGAGEKAGSSRPCAKVRKSASNRTGGAEDAPWKVDASETSHGQSVTGTQTGWSEHLTGEEPGSCRTVTGTEYLGADIFREFCHTGPQPSVAKVGVSRTGHGRQVTGNEMGRGERVTGNEPGTCKQVTGTEYLSPEQYESYCNTRPAPAPSVMSEARTESGLGVTGDLPGQSARVTGGEPGADRAVTGTQYTQRGRDDAPEKVGSSRNLGGGGITGSQVGRSERVTGDEPGTCRNVTGDDYIGREQYRDFCGTEPGRPSEEKVGVSGTLGGHRVSGTMTGRNARVTGDEPGTCQAVTGTPYAGAEQYRSYCDPEDAQMAAARRPQGGGTPGPSMTGDQPGLNGKLTGAEDGACQTPTGTPYVGGDQYAEACPVQAAEPHSPDYPQPLDAPWTDFSVQPPAHAADAEPQASRVTGTSYEQGQITGAFSMAEGKVTGTEDFRHGGSGGSVQPASQRYAQPQPPQSPAAREEGRVTGEGMDVGPAITGDDWDRGERVTGTEGTAARRNPSRRGQPGTAMPMDWAQKRNEDVPLPESPVTGGAGNTEKGAGVTYSGGARG